MCLSFSSFVLVLYVIYVLLVPYPFRPFPDLRLFSKSVNLADLKGNFMIKPLEFFAGKRIFVTGSTGFKGSWLCYILTLAGAEVSGYALQQPQTPVCSPS